MQIRNNRGELIGEVNVFFATDGSQVTANTTYSNGRVLYQTVSTRDNQGQVETRSFFGGKVLP